MKEVKFYIYSGTSEQYKYSVYAKDEAELKEKISAIIHEPICKFTKLEKSEGYPKYSYHYSYGPLDHHKVLVVGSFEHPEYND